MTRTGRPPAAALLAALAALVTVAGACSGGDGDSSGGDATADARQPAATVADAGGDADTSGENGSGEAGDGGSAAGGSGGAGGSVQLAAAQLGRQVVRTGWVSVTVDDVAAAVADAVRIAEAVGGFQATGSLSLADEHATGEVVVRVPAPQFRSVLEAIGGLGEVTDEQVGSEDVTGRVVDLEARAAAARISVERVRGFLDRTGDVAQLAAVERELLTRESELEALLGQLAALRDQVDLATVTARFAVDADVAELAAAEGERGGGVPGPGRALRNGWELLVDAGRVVAAAVAFALPWSPLALAAWFGVRLARGTARKLGT